jgi:hypothetical protein
VEVVDYLIGSVQEFNGWYETDWTSTYNKGIKIVLTDNIVLPQDKYYSWNTKYEKEFNGIIDGNGYRIENFSSCIPFIRYLSATGVIENLAMTNMSTKDGYLGLVGGYLYGTVRNCYFEGTVKNGAGVNGMYHEVFSGSVIENVVVKVSYEQPSPSEYAVTHNSYANFNPGLYMVNDNYDKNSTTENGKLSSNTSLCKTVFSSVEELKEALTVEGQLVLPNGFDANLWEFDSNGMLVMKEKN